MILPVSSEPSIKAHRTWLYQASDIEVVAYWKLDPTVAQFPVE